MAKKIIIGAILIFSIAVAVNLYLMMRKEPSPALKNEQIIQPFNKFIHGYGIVIPSSEFVNLGIDYTGIVTKIFVQNGDVVSEGEALLQLDIDVLAKEREELKTKVNVKKAGLQKLKALPNIHDVTIHTALVQEANAKMQEAEERYQNLENITSTKAISKEERLSRYYTMKHAESSLQKAMGELEKIKEGAWKPDVEVAEAELKNAEAELALLEEKIQKRTLKAPFNGVVLKLYAHIGELAIPDKSLVLFGSKDKNIQVDISEYEINDLKPSMKAVAYLKGNKEKSYPLKFVRIEPYVFPLELYTEDVNQRKDTRVIRLIYKFAGDDTHIRTGQQVDVYIENY